MLFFGRWSSALLAAAFFSAAGGCSPMDQGPVAEEKEPHYVLGKSRVNAMDYTGAIEAFEESLDANPHSAQAHYQLAMLYENQESDPAAAIYHYQQYLKYDPQAENADIITQHVASCKQQLATDVLQLPSAPAVQQQLEKMADQNRQLQQKVDQLNEVVKQWNAYYANQQSAAKTNLPGVQNNFTAPMPVTSQTPDDVTTDTGTVAGTTAAHKPVPPKVSKPRTHTVVSGDTLAGIARKQGVSLEALEAANPGVNPKKLKAGQVLNLPAS